MANKMCDHCCGFGGVGLRRCTVCGGSGLKQETEPAQESSPLSKLAELALDMTIQLQAKIKEMDQEIKRLSSAEETIRQSEKLSKVFRDLQDENKRLRDFQDKYYELKHRNEMLELQLRNLR